MSKPLFNIVITRKDGETQNYTNYKGEEVSSKYRRIGAIWPNKNTGEPGSISFGDKDGPKKITIDTEKFWVNVYSTEDDQPRGKKQGGKKQGLKQLSGDDDGELNFDE